MSDAGYATRHLSRGAIGGIFAGDVEGFVLPEGERYLPVVAAAA